MNVFLAPSDMIDLKWPLLARFLYPAVATSNGRWELDDVLVRLRDGRFQAWLAAEGSMLYGVGITQIIVYPRLKALECIWLGGVEFDRWMLELDHAACDWAIREGCSRLEIWGRRGWERMGKPIGFAPRCVVYEKDVNYGRRRNAGDQPDKLACRDARVAEESVSNA